MSGVSDHTDYTKGTEALTFLGSTLLIAHWMDRSGTEVMLYRLYPRSWSLAGGLKPIGNRPLHGRFRDPGESSTTMTFAVSLAPRSCFVADDVSVNRNTKGQSWFAGRYTLRIGYLSMPNDTSTSPENSSSHKAFEVPGLQPIVVACWSLTTGAWGNAPSWHSASACLISQTCPTPGQNLGERRVAWSFKRETATGRQPLCHSISFCLIKSSASTSFPSFSLNAVSS